MSLAGLPGGGIVAYHVHDPNIPFVRTDIERFAQVHARVVLFVMKPVEAAEQLPPNVQVVLQPMDWKRFRPAWLTVRHLAAVLWIYLGECRAKGRMVPLVATVRKLVSNIFHANEVMRHLRATGAEGAWHYGFWFYDCIHLAWQKRSGRTAFAAARAHSGDLYDEHVSNKRGRPLRAFQLAHLDAVWPVSRMGEDYLKRRFPTAKARFAAHYLGTADPGMLNPPGTGELVLVSCATLRHHKRVHRIAEALALVDVPVTWLHFGGEGSRKDPAWPDWVAAQEALKQRPNITFRPMGYTPNSALRAHYARHHVSLFVSLSRYEGIPVSMMEAISYGIPVLSTDVGGCREIVTEQSGLLIPEDMPVAEVARLIASFATSPAYTETFRQGVRAFWSAHFNMDTNYGRFFTELTAR